MSSNNNSKPQRRSANPVISLNQFAHAKSKGTRRAIENYKQKRTSKFNRNAGLLREYRKAMKNEGYDAGKGASRKRSLNGDGDHVEVEHDDDKELNENKEDGNEQKTKKRRHKADPLAKAKEMAKHSKQDQLHQKETRAKEIEDNKRKATQKQLRARKLAKRTNRGQPIMKVCMNMNMQSMNQSFFNYHLASVLFCLLCTNSNKILSLFIECCR